MTYSDVVKPPWVEDKEHCANDEHLWILKHDGSIYCYNCKMEKKPKDEELEI